MFAAKQQLLDKQHREAERKKQLISKQRSENENKHKAFTEISAPRDVNGSGFPHPLPSSMYPVSRDPEYTALCGNVYSPLPPIDDPSQKIGKSS